MHYVLHYTLGYFAAQGRLGTPRDAQGRSLINALEIIKNDFQHTMKVGVGPGRPTIMAWYVWHLLYWGLQLSPSRETEGEIIPFKCATMIPYSHIFGISLLSMSCGNHFATLFRATSLCVPARPSGHVPRTYNSKKTQGHRDAQGHPGTPRDKPLEIAENWCK